MPFFLICFSISLFHSSSLDALLPRQQRSGQLSTSELLENILRCMHVEFPVIWNLSIIIKFFHLFYYQCYSKSVRSGNLFKPMCAS